MKPSVLLIAGVLWWLPMAGAMAQDAAAGEQAARKCMACHDFSEGGGNRVGPPLFGIVGRPAAALPGFGYSATLVTMGTDAGLVWTPDKLDTFLENPRAFVPGTKMAFAGIRREAERANIIAYLISLSPDYVPRGRPPAPPPPPFH